MNENKPYKWSPQVHQPWSTELMGVSDDPCADGAFGDGKMNDGYTLED